MSVAPSADRPRLDVDIWSDVVCPWCYIGKRRFERAVGEVADEIDVSITYRPYQLDPTAPPGSTQPVREAYARKFGGPERAAQIIDHVTRTAAGDGLGFRLDRAIRANTLLAHRLLWWAARPDVDLDQAAVKEVLLRAYFVDGRDVGDPDTLAELASEVGADRDDVLAMLASDAGEAEVRADLAQAAELGITAVPTFVIADRWSVPGAQDPETFVAVLRRLRDAIAADDDSAG